jgi:catechol 2,3-dioxygenase-like lactoylglutathione lyase family enzyme
LSIPKLTLYTSDLSAIKEFYSSVLSLKIISESNDKIVIQIGETELTFKKFSGDKDPFYHFAFNIPSNKIEEAMEWIKGKVNLLPISDNNYIADFVNWNAKSIYFLDPAGNIVELIARFDLRSDIKEKFNSSQILNVSEIGIVTNYVPAFRQKLIEQYKVFDFVKSLNSDTFSAMGDDNGLFIVASENRNWYPTQIPSQKSPFEITFINDAGSSTHLSDKIM